MALSPTGQRMLGALPSYYYDDPLMLRIVQALANEVDLLEKRLLAVRAGLLPSVSTDLLGLLSLWEGVFGLPVAPAATEAQRRATLSAAIRKLGALTGALTLETLETAAAGTPVRILENTPGPLQDTIEIPYGEGSYSAGQIQELAERIWPAHRRVLMRYTDGFLLDKARLDAETL